MSEPSEETAREHERKAQEHDPHERSPAGENEPGEPADRSAVDERGAESPDEDASKAAPPGNPIIRS